MFIQIQNTVLIYYPLNKSNIIFYYFILILLYLCNQALKISTTAIIVIAMSIINKLMLKKHILFKTRVCNKLCTCFQVRKSEKNIFKSLGFVLKLQPNEQTIVSHTTLCS